MAHRDSSTGELVLRLVLDGPPLAGKTTTLVALSSLLGEPIIRGDGPDGRTAVFDWVEHTGGVFEGQRIRFQMVAVPGHPELRHRRLHLLADADVVVLVLDSTEPGLTAGIVHLADFAQDHGVDAVPPMVVQANKQDLPTAAPSASIESAVRRFVEAIDVVPTSAITAGGLRMLLAVAARRALQHIRAEASELGSAPPLTYEGLLGQLIALDRPHPEPEVEQRANRPPLTEVAPRLTRSGRARGHLVRLVSRFLGDLFR